MNINKRFGAAVAAVMLAAAAMTIPSAQAQNPRQAKPIVSILGDSYSTFEDFIPQGNATWYAPNPQEERTDVGSVRQTWWWQTVSEGGYILGVNESYSGATISYTGYRGDDYSDRSFVTRLRRVGPCDILLIFGATNDSWTDGPIGEYRYDKPLTRGHMFEFRPALGRLLREAQERLPGTRILFLVNTELKPEITSSIVEECKYYGVECLLLHDIDKRSGHPTAKGMEAIKRQVLDALAKQPRL